MQSGGNETVGCSLYDLLLVMQSLNMESKILLLTDWKDVQISEVDILTFKLQRLRTAGLWGMG